MEKDIHRQARFYSGVLVDWHRENPRFLPWKETRDPYRIWLSEVILQQTQVAQGLPYYNKFIEKYPHVRSLADAELSDVLNDWQGLGYNSRAVNLKKAAETVAYELGGRFPDSYDGLLALQGVGPYTAAAIASFAYGEGTPVLDANVIRVLCRLFGITGEPARAQVKSQLYDILHAMIADTDPAEFNQAIMNFGALQCKPRNPHCVSCPLAEVCVAYNGNLVDRLPTRPSRRKRRERYFDYLVITSGEGLLMRQRDDSDIWPYMYDFPVLEHASRTPMDTTTLHKWATETAAIDPVNSSFDSYVVRQMLTHQTIHATFHTCKVEGGRIWPRNSALTYVEYGKLDSMAVPKVVDCYFRSNSILL